MAEPATPSPESPWLNPWPGELEGVPSCPACGSKKRRLLHPDLGDKSFRTAPGVWTMIECQDCASGFLDPRPTIGSIGGAYAQYYTHAGGGPAKTSYRSLSPLRRLRRRLTNGFLSEEFGYLDEPKSKFGHFLLGHIPSFRRRLAREFRNMPAPTGRDRRLLDVGCGNGNFLSLAVDCGWHAEGLEPDAQAVAQARSAGLQVHHGGLEHFDGQSELFDFITLDNVLEHIHDPIGALQACRRLLRPDGVIWIETPNIGSPGHREFGPDWRGLEVPRHLVLFNHGSLRDLLSRAGFAEIRDHPRPSETQWMFGASYAMSTGRLPNTVVSLPSAMRLKIVILDVAQRLVPGYREFVTMTAARP